MREPKNVDLAEKKSIAKMIFSRDVLFCQWIEHFISQFFQFVLDMLIDW